MTNPVYKIETYTGAAKDHTIEKNALNIYFKEVVTDGIGHFSFMVPTKKNGGTYIYDDIALYDKVKIYLGYDNVGETPNFVGRVGTISAPLSIQGGYVRVISGLSQGEILLDRLKKNKYYDAVGASTIVTELASDLGLGTGQIAADATAVTMEVRTKTYFDVLKAISDYWYNAGTQIKKDFYVDVNNNLVWKSRPIRTAGVETLTVGENVLHYDVTRQIRAVRNDIVVYGKPERYLPSDKDEWTESLTNWSASSGSLSLNSTDEQVGTYCIQCNSGEGSTNTFKRDLNRITIRTIQKLNLYRYCDSYIIAAKVRLLAPDTSNYFEADMGSGLLWYFYTFEMGPDHVYDATERPTEPWTETGSPNWWDIQGLQFHFTHSVGTGKNSLVDGIYFYPERFVGTGTDAGSKTAYGTRELEVSDVNLASDSDCTKRAETLLYQRKDPPIQIDMTVVGNTNILVGDRLVQSIPAENISAVNFDVIAVEQSFSAQGFMTKLTMMNSVNVREPLETSQTRSLINLRSLVRSMLTEETHIR